MNDFKMREISELKCDLITYLKSHMSGKLDDVDTKEAGEVADIIKDLAEAEKNCYEACYYKTVIEAMETGKDEDYYGYDDRYGYNTPPRPNHNAMRNKYGYKPMVDQEPYIRDYMEGRRYGYTSPETTDSVVHSIKDMWATSDPVKRAELKKELGKLINEMD